MRTFAILATTFLLVASCAGRGRTVREITAIGAVARALDEADGLALIRYNPPQCACAPFEIRTAEGWVRADFTEADEEGDLDTLLARAESDGARGVSTEYQVPASLVTATTSFCQNRVPYASLRLKKE